MAEDVNMKPRGERSDELQELLGRSGNNEERGRESDLRTRQLSNNNNNKIKNNNNKRRKIEEEEESKQEKQNRAALELIERTGFLRPLLYVQDIDLLNEYPETEGYISGRYVGTGIERRFERGTGEDYPDFLENSTITDIGFDGNHLYVVDNELGHYRVNDPEKDPRIKEGLPEIEVTAKLVDGLARDVSNRMGEEYTTAKPIFDAELGYLRTNFVSEAVAPFGNTMALRISRPSLAIKDLADMATPEVVDLLEVFMRTKTNILISGATGSGKSIRDNEPILTTKGWKTHGELELGDYVYDRLGKPTKVIGVYPQGELDVYRLTLKDGRTVDASGDHLWTIIEDNKLNTYNTKTLLEKEGVIYIPKANSEYGKDEIQSIKKIDVKGHMTCIMVDNEEHLYQVGEGIVTHNTEAQKKLVGYIPQNQKITLMEDTLDSHIKAIYPEKDINSWQTQYSEEGSTADNIDFHTLLRAALRNFPDWAMVSEVRGEEAGALLSVALSGHSVMTTLHAQGAEFIPERLADMVSMGNSKMDYGALQRNILSVFNIGVHLERGTDPVTGKTIRYIREIYEYVDYDSANGVIGYPVYRRYQEYDRKTGTYSVEKKHYRLSDNMLNKITNYREYDKVPLDFKSGEYSYKTISDRKDITKGDEE